MVTQVLLHAYFLVMDLLLLGQVYYYARTRHTYKRVALDDAGGTEVEDVFYEPETSSDYSSRSPSLHSVTPLPASLGLPLLMVASKSLGDITDVTASQVIALALGYSSAVCFVGARIPQIRLNHRNKSCEGLAIGLFIFGVLGNVTYCLSVLCHSLDPKYLFEMAPWLLGSAGTFIFDGIVSAKVVQPHSSGQSSLTTVDLCSVLCLRQKGRWEGKYRSCQPH